MGRRSFVAAGIATAAGCSTSSPAKTVHTTSPPRDERTRNVQNSGTRSAQQNTPEPGRDERPVRSIAFDRVVNAVEDLGMDPTGSQPIDDALDRAFAEGTLVEFPAGEYLVARTHRNYQDFGRFGLRGLGTSPRDVQFAPVSGENIVFLDVRHVGSHLVENVSFNDRFDDSSALSLILKTTDGSVVRDVEWLGTTPKEPNHKGTMLVVDATTTDGVCVIENLVAGVDAPAVSATYPDGVQCVRSSAAHEGELIVRNPVIHRRSSTALRCTVGDGVLTLEGGEFVNNLNSSIRFGAGKHPSKKSSATGSYVRIDDDIAHTQDKIDAVRVNSSGLSDVAESGATFRDIRIEVELSGPLPGRGVITIPSFANHGRVEFHNCVVRNDAPADFPTVWAAPTTASDGAIIVKNSRFTGSGGGFVAIDRPGSVIVGSWRQGRPGNACSIEMPNAQFQGFDVLCLETGP